MLAAVLGHEFHEVYGLYKLLTEKRVMYGELQDKINKFHIEAVKLGDEIAKKALLLEKNTSTGVGYDK